jgi:hypothetical protein
MPMLCFRWDIDYIAGAQLAGGLSPFLVPASSASHEKDLPALMVYMPEIAASGLKGHIAYENPFRRQHVQVAGAGKILGIRFVLFPLGKNPDLSRCIILLLTHIFLHRLVQNLVKNDSSIFRNLRSTLDSQNAYKFPKLLRGQAVVHAYNHMPLQLSFNALDICQSGHGRQFSVLPVQHVTLEDVAEEVGFQELVDGRGKIIQRPCHRLTNQLRLVFRAKFKAIFVGRNGACLLAYLVLDALFSLSSDGRHLP